MHPYEGKSFYFFEFATISQLTTCLEAGANPNAITPAGWAPLHGVAAFDRSPEVVTVLLRAGADPNARDSCERTPLHVAVDIDTLAILEFKPPRHEEDLVPC